MVNVFLNRLNINGKCYYNLPNSVFWGWLSVESPPQILNSGIILKTFTHVPQKTASHQRHWPWQETPRITYFLWKVCLKVLNSGITWKTFTHVPQKTASHQRHWPWQETPRITYFLWKVSLKVLNSGITWKTFTHVPKNTASHQRHWPWQQTPWITCCVMTMPGIKSSTC